MKYTLSYRIASDVILEAKLWLRGTSRDEAKIYGLGLEGPGLGLGLESCIDNF